AAENEHDLDGIMATYHESPTITINGRAISGSERVRGFHQRFGFGGEGGSFAEVSVVENARHISAGAIILEQTLSGRQVASYNGIAAMGRSFSVAVCTVYRFTPEGKLESEDVYFDSARLAEQLRG